MKTPEPLPAVRLWSDLARAAALAGLKAELDGLAAILAFQPGRTQSPTREADFDNLPV